MNNKLIWSFYIGLLLTSISCNKHCKPSEVDTTIPIAIPNCPEMYSQLSKEYINPYMGTIFTSSMFTPDNIYPDKYLYSHPCVNPNNEFEFCYLRCESKTQSRTDLDLYKFNFCTGKATLITKHVALTPDWSTRDWILFTGSNGNLWKIKSNGDSLIQLTNFSQIQIFAKWNPSGTCFYCDGNKIADQNGNVIQTLPFTSDYHTWKTDSVLFYAPLNDSINTFYVYEYNIFTNTTNTILTEPKTGIGRLFKLNPKYNILYMELDTSYYRKYLQLDLNTMQKTKLGVYQQSFEKAFMYRLKDKIFAVQMLKDTMTGSPELLNYRSHIVIMNTDESNESQILIPE